VGEHSTWRVAHTEFTDWNTPRLVEPNPGGGNRYSFLSRNYSGIGGAWLIPPEDGAGPRSKSGSESDLRVFDHPGCVEITPATEISASQWALLFPTGVSPRIDEIIPIDSPQLAAADVVKAWESVTSDVVLFYNLNKTPHTFFCADGTGIEIGRYFSRENYGKSFRWHFEDARQVVKNAAWLKIDYDDSNLSSRQILTDIEAMVDPYSQIIGLASEDCSIETGVAYLESIDLPPGFKGPIDPKGSGGYAQ
jgi:hypothetical protein